jgi:hypothetical protein
MEIHTVWEEVKHFFDDNKPAAKLAYVELSDRYEVWASYRDVSIRCRVVKDSEVLEQFTPYIPQANISEASPVRITTCRIGRALHDRFIAFKTATIGAPFDNTDWRGQDWGDVSYLMKDSTGATTTDPTLATESWLSFFPSWDYEVSGGHLDVPSELTGDLDLWEGHIVGAPDIPVSYGGSKQFVCNPRLKWFRGIRLPIEADLNPKDVSGAVSAYARKILLVVKHPQGAVAEFQLRLKLFV